MICAYKVLLKIPIFVTVGIAGIFIFARVYMQLTFVSENIIVLY